MIRPSVPDDRDRIIELVREAFTGDGRDGHDEVDIVRATWARNRADTIELVAVDDSGVIIGHVLGAAGDVDGRELLAVAPLCAAPAHQHAGVGTALMHALLEQADAAGWPAVVLLGNPKYYARFGFEPAPPLGVVYPPVDPELPHFQLRKLTRYDPSITGHFRYCWEAD
jgi:putative acetyltransferase